MEKQKKFIINFLYFAIIIAAVFLALQFALTLLFPFVAALFIAYILKHPIRFVSEKTRLPRRLVAVLMVLIFYGTIGTFLVLASIRAFSFVSDLVQQLPQIFRIYVNPVLGDLFVELERALEQADPNHSGYSRLFVGYSLCSRCEAWSQICRLAAWRQSRHCLLTSYAVHQAGLMVVSTFLLLWTMTV